MTLHLACTSANCHAKAELSDKKAKSRDLDEVRERCTLILGNSNHLQR